MNNIPNKEIMGIDKLSELDADIVYYHGLQCFVKFNIEGYEISYGYNINAKNKFYLQRIKPYPMPAGVFDDVNDVINVIKIDIDLFKNAVKSGKLEKFISISTEILNVVRNFEDLFLYYNVSPEIFNELNQIIGILKDKILTGARESKRVYTENDPKTI